MRIFAGYATIKSLLDQSIKQPQLERSSTAAIQLRDLSECPSLVQYMENNGAVLRLKENDLEGPNNVVTGTEVTCLTDHLQNNAKITAVDLGINQWEAVTMKELGPLFQTFLKTGKSGEFTGAPLSSILKEAAEMIKAGILQIDPSIKNMLISYDYNAYGWDSQKLEHTPTVSGDDYGYLDTPRANGTMALTLEKVCIGTRTDCREAIESFVKACEEKGVKVLLRKDSAPLLHYQLSNFISFFQIGSFALPAQLEAQCERGQSRGILSFLPCNLQPYAPVPLIDRVTCKDAFPKDPNAEEHCEDIPSYRNNILAIPIGIVGGLLAGGIQGAIIGKKEGKVKGAIAGAAGASIPTIPVIIGIFTGTPEAAAIGAGLGIVEIIAITAKGIIALAKSCNHRNTHPSQEPTS